MSEEKNPHRVTVTVESDGETKVFEGVACAVTVVSDAYAQGMSAGGVSMEEAIPLMMGIGRHIGHIASTKGLSDGVAVALAADGIKAQMKKSAFSDLLACLDSALEKCGECQEADSKES